MAGILRVPHTPLHEGELTLSVETSRYVVKVHRKSEGASLVLFDAESRKEAEAVLSRAHPSEARVSVKSVRESPKLSMPVWLFQSLGKGDKPDQAVRDATVLGAEKVVLVRSSRSVAKASGEERLDRLRRVAIECARQAERTDLPEIVGPLDFDDALALTPRGIRVVLGWDESERPLLDRLLEWRESDEIVSCFVGPEGGFEPAELETLASAGFLTSSLGPLVLRTEVAATVALGTLRLVWDQKKRRPS